MATLAADAIAEPFANVLPPGVAIRPTGQGLGAEVTGVDLSGDAHPITGREILFVNESFTRHVVGWPPDDSRALLDELFAHLQDPAFRYRHSWQEGDYVLWDNAATQHLAVFDYDDLPRRLHRCGTDGPLSG